MGLNRGAAGTLKGRDASGGSVLVPPDDSRQTLAEAGIDKKLSAHAQKVASIPEPEFEGIVGEWRETLETANERAACSPFLVGRGRHSRRGRGARLMQNAYTALT